MELAYEAGKKGEKFQLYHFDTEEEYYSVN